MMLPPQHLIDHTVRFILLLDFLMATAKILIVENNLNLLATLKYNLLKEGHGVITAADCA
jgi:hypothetical protein